jgi:hypothetical protein
MYQESCTRKYTGQCSQLHRDVRGKKTHECVKPNPPPVISGKCSKQIVYDQKYADFYEDIKTALRTTYGPSILCSHEFIRFFSPSSLRALRNAIYYQSGGYYPDMAELVEKMLEVFSDEPGAASDPTEPFRECVTPEIADRHVRRLMHRVVEELGYEVEQANKLWHYYETNINGPTDVPDQPMACSIRNANCYSSNMDWLLSK